MIRRQPLRPPSDYYPPDEWNVIERGYHPEFMAQMETIFAVANGYLGMRGCPEEGGPNAETVPSLMASMKRGRSYTARTRLVSQRPDRPSPM